MKRCLEVWLLILLMISCSESEQPVPDSGIDYYPMQVGNYAIYQVEEFSMVQSVATAISYELKVTFADSMVNKRGEVTYILIREKKNPGSENWESHDTWSVRLSNNRVLQNEGNTWFVKLIFPPSLNLSWDGNQFNNLPDNGELFYDGDKTPYYITAIDQPVALTTGFEADQSLTVIANDFNDDVIGIDERKEVYARGIGLVYKETYQLERCNSTLCSADQSYRFVQSLKEYGRK